MVFTAFLLGAQHERERNEEVKKKLASALVVLLKRTQIGISLPLCGTPLVRPSDLPFAVGWPCGGLVLRWAGLTKNLQKDEKLICTV